MALQALLWTRFDEVLRVRLQPREEDGHSRCNSRKDLQIYSEQAKAQKDHFSKKFLQNGEFRMDDYFNVAIMTPVLHYTMGGLEIDPESRVLAPGNKLIPDCSPLVRLRVVSMALTVSVVRLYSNVLCSDVLPVIVRLRIACSFTQVQRTRPRVVLTLLQVTLVRL